MKTKTISGDKKNLNSIYVFFKALFGKTTEAIDSSNIELPDELKKSLAKIEDKEDNYKTYVSSLDATIKVDQSKNNESVSKDKYKDKNQPSKETNNIEKSI